MNILVTQPCGEIRDSFFSDEAFEILSRLGNVKINETSENYTEDELAQIIKDVDVLVTGWNTTRLTEKILGNAEKLKIVGHTGGTVATIVDEKVFEKGIRVLTGNQVFAESVAEGTLCYMLCALRRIVDYASLMKEGGWKDAIFENKGLFEKTIGIVGFGTIARHLIRMLKPFNVTIKVFSNSLKEEDAKSQGLIKASLEEVFSTCDIISLHCSLTDKTRHMINADLLSKIKDGGLLVNTARGAVIKEEDLIAELEKGRFTAFLDVFEIEPLPRDSKLRTLENAILIPHMGGPTMDHRKVVTKRLVRGIEDIINGRETDLEVTCEMVANMTR